MQSENTEKMRNKKPDDWGTAVTQSHECTHTREAGVWQFQGFCEIQPSLSIATVQREDQTLSSGESLISMLP